jgi:hypothetical protein
MRKQAIVTIDARGRDKGKTFLLTELPTADSEEWAGRALFALMNAGVDIPENIAEAGLAGLMAMGVKAITKLPFEMAKPLLDKMMECVQIQPSPTVIRPLISDDIEEVSTMFKLRKEIWNLHTDFFTDAGQSTPDLPASTTHG